MSQEWMIDVLTDLKCFAYNNGLMALAEQLDDTIHTAVTELKQTSQDNPPARAQTTPDHSVHRPLAAGNNL